MGDGSAFFVFMQPNLYSSASPGAANASDGNHPVGVTLDPLFGDLYIIDTDNNRALIYQGGMSPTSDAIPATAVLGQSDFAQQTPGSALDQMYNPNRGNSTPRPAPSG